MFIYIIERDPLGKARYIDKYICKEECSHCSIRFNCFTKTWKAFCYRGSSGALYDRKEIIHIPVGIKYCSTLAIGMYQKLFDGGIC